jgi:hypothetical protein
MLQLKKQNAAAALAIARAETTDYIFLQRKIN